MQACLRSVEATCRMAERWNEVTYDFGSRPLYVLRSPVSHRFVMPAGPAAGPAGARLPRSTVVSQMSLSRHSKPSIKSAFGQAQLTSDGIFVAFRSDLGACYIHMCDSSLCANQ